MTEKPADHGTSPEDRAADTPPAPGARSAEGGTLPLPTEPLPTDETTPLSADEPTGHRPAEPVTAHTDIESDADGTVGPDGDTGATEGDTAAADVSSTALHAQTRDHTADDVTEISAPTPAGEPPTSEFGGSPPTNEFGAT